MFNEPNIATSDTSKSINDRLILADQYQIFNPTFTKQNSLDVLQYTKK